MTCVRCGGTMRQSQICLRCGYRLCATCFDGDHSPCAACRRQLELLALCDLVHGTTPQELC
jgi:hypothetical protein